MSRFLSGKIGKQVADALLPQWASMIVVFACFGDGLPWDGLQAADAPATDAWRASSGQKAQDAGPHLPPPSQAIDRELFAPEPKATQPPEAKAKPQGLVSLDAIVEKMVQTARRLSEIDPGPGTQQLQQRILEDLEAILRQAEQSAQGKTAPKQSDPNRPDKPPQSEIDAKPQADDGKSQTASAKPDGQPEPGQAAASGKGPDGHANQPVDRSSLLRRVWGDLPIRQRNEILQFQPPDEFLPEYEAEIEAYFRRLAEGREATAWGPRRGRGE